MLNTNDSDILKKSLPFWDNLSSNEKDLIISNSINSFFPKNTSLYSGENECIGLMYVKSGSIRTYITSKEGREVTLYCLDAGDICILSASCVLNTITFDVSVVADADCEIIKLSAPIFSKIMKTNVYVELFSYKLATQRFSDVMWSMQQLLFTSFDVRLAIFLLDESSRTNSTDIKMTHEQIAKYLGSAREVVSRMLKYFSKEGYVSLYRGGIKITNKAALLSIANNGISM